MPEELPVLKSRPMGGQAVRTHWLSPKRQRTMSLSEDAWEICGRLAEETDANRSEILEVLLRHCENMEFNLTIIRAKLVQLEEKRRNRAKKG